MFNQLEKQAVSEETTTDTILVLIAGGGTILLNVLEVISTLLILCPSCIAALASRGE